MKHEYFNSIGALYGNMLNGIKKELIKEGKKQPPNAFNSKFPVEKYKQPNGDGVKEPLNDEKECEEDNEEVPYKKPSKLSKTLGRMDNASKNPKLSEKQRQKISREKDRIGQFRMEEDDENEESEKSYTESINRVMKQSTFDKLYKKVLKENFGQEDTGELDALGLDDATPDTELDDEFGDDLGDETEGEGDSVTFTLDRATAQALVDVLQGALGGDVEDDLGGEDDLDLEGDFEGEDDFGGEGDDLKFGEEDNEEIGTKEQTPPVDKLLSKANKVGGNANPKGSKKADPKLKNQDQGSKEGAPSFTHLQGKDPKVNASGIPKPGSYFFK